MRRKVDVTRWVGRLLCAVVASALLAPAPLCAQDEPEKSTNATPAAAPTATSTEPAAPLPLGRYVPKDHLVVYVEFAGLDHHASSWKNTAAYKMLNETPLGAMLEAVAGQLLDKALTFVPNHRLSGPEIVKLAEGAAKGGWVFAFHVDPKGPQMRATLVLRGAVSKELKPLASRLMGWMMGTDAKPRTERKEGRTVVVVPTTAAKPAGGTAPLGWVWWPEQTDLVMGGPYPAVAESIMSVLDGKAPSAVDHPIAQELRKATGSFEPVCVAFVDTAGCPELPTQFTVLLKNLAKFGINRLDYQWGFDAEALMTVTRMVAPRPWKTGLAVFDQPTFEKSSLVPMPESVSSFVELSINPSKLLDELEKIGPPGVVKAQIDDLSASIKSAGQIDLRKDILAHLGPRMVAFLAPGRSAAANDDSLESAMKNGFTSTAVVTAMQSYLPKLTLVAEIDDPVAFGKGLDTMMIAINNELEAQALEKEAEERKAAEKEKPEGAAPGRGAGRRSGEGSERTRKSRVLAPRFNPIPGQARSFVLMTPSDSKLRFGPSSFRPTILVQGKYVAFAVSTDAARAAVAAVAQKDWKPSSEIERVCAHVPSKLVVLSVTDGSETLSSLLASLPGTLQTVINTSIALSKARANGALASGPNGPGSGPGPGSGMMAPGGMMRGGMGPGMGGSASMPGGGMRRGGPMMAGSGGLASGSQPGVPGMGPGPPGAPGSGAAESDAMIIIKVDADKLPKAGDLKAHLFPATFAIQVADQEIRFISRTAFPDLSVLIGMIPAFGMMPRPPMGDQVPGAQPGATVEGAAGQPGVAPAAPGSPPAGPAGPGPGPGGRRGRGGR